MTPGTGLQQLLDSLRLQLPASHKADISDLHQTELPDSLYLVSTGSEGPLLDHASDQLESPDPPVLSDAVAHVPSTNDVTARIQA